MISVFVSQQHQLGPHQEWHDCLDQRWPQLLQQADILAIPVPNHAELVMRLWQQIKPAGVILTGGGEFDPQLADPRSQTEQQLIKLALEHNKPLVGVCRGMQALLQSLGNPLQATAGHVCPRQSIQINQQTISVNSFHNFGFKSLDDPNIEVWARADDGVIKAIQHKQAKQLGIMWHPERPHAAQARSIQLLQRLFVQQEYPCAHLF
ncbi:gamma-glutamyl-gamma-aminobutyrate hydrolase family protein [Agarivorans sp. QJM3NY_33]|uniref:gamma-glutamyl-gamma-aminobutyrate hydrolase family protein n=1 Tax=Agarivorans sp. QJM3NY_33 TaxID=3421432 RepID=UPI003D7CA1F9